MNAYQKAYHNAKALLAAVLNKSYDVSVVWVFYFNIQIVYINPPINRFQNVI